MANGLNLIKNTKNSLLSLVLMGIALLLIGSMIVGEWSSPYTIQQPARSAMVRYSSEAEFNNLLTGLKSVRSIQYDEMIHNQNGFSIKGPFNTIREPYAIFHIPYYETGYKNPYIVVQRISGVEVWIIDSNGKIVYSDNRVVRSPAEDPFLSQMTARYDRSGIDILVKGTVDHKMIGLRGFVGVLPYSSVLKLSFSAGYLRRVIGAIMLLSALFLFTMRKIIRLAHSQNVLEDLAQFFALFGIWILLDFERYDFWILTTFDGMPSGLLSLVLYFAIGFIPYCFSSFCYHTFSETHFSSFLKSLRLYALILGILYFSAALLSIFTRSEFTVQLFSIIDHIHQITITIGSFLLILISVTQAFQSRRIFVFTVGMIICEGTFIISQNTPFLISHWGVLILGLCFVIIITMEFNATKLQNLEHTETLETKNRQLSDLYTDLEKAQHEILYLLGSAVDMRSQETSNHVKRVSEYSRIFAKALGYEEGESDLIALASTLHDIGKVGIPDGILNKPGRLTAEEFALMKQHALMGYNMLKNSDQELIQTAAIIALTHHERYDGGGYPHGKSGDDIHPYGRIVAASDVLDALLSSRIYKAPWSFEAVLDYFKEQRGIQFEPAIVDIFLEQQSAFRKIAETQY